jgi:hypothetical protein
MTTHSVFDPTQTPAVVRADDGTPTIECGTGFYLFGVTGWDCVGARLYLPDVTGIASVTMRLWEFDGGNPDFAVDTPARTAVIAAPAVGWNSVSWAAYTMTDAAPVWVSYDTGIGAYMFESIGFANDALQSYDSSELFLSEGFSGTWNRSVFRIGAGAMGTGDNSGWYGTDILVDDGLTPDPGGNALRVALRSARTHVRFPYVTGYAS